MANAVQYVSFYSSLSLSFSLVVLSHSWLGMHRDGQENIQADQRLEEWIDRHVDVLSKQCT